MSQAVYSDLLQYADGFCLVLQHKNIEEIKKDIKIIEEHLNRYFSALIDWFVDNT